MLTVAQNWVAIRKSFGVIPSGGLAGGNKHWFNVSGSRITSGTGSGNIGEPFVVFDPVDWPGYSVMNLHVSLSTTAVQTGVTLTFGLYPITFSGSTTLVPTLGTVVTNSTIDFVAPGTAAEVSGSASFDIPAVDTYMPGLTLSGTTDVNSVTLFTVVLRMR